MIRSTCAHLETESAASKPSTLHRATHAYILLQASRLAIVAAVLLRCRFSFALQVEVSCMTHVWQNRITQVTWDRIKVCVHVIMFMSGYYYMLFSCVNMLYMISLFRSYAPRLIIFNPTTCNSGCSHDL